MLSYQSQPRHWTPREGYATGDVLVGLLDKGWNVHSARMAPGNTVAPQYIVTVTRGTDVMTMLVVDGPFIRSLISTTNDTPAQ